MADTVLHELMPPNHRKKNSAPESEYDFLLDFPTPQLHHETSGSHSPIQDWEPHDILRWIIQVAEKFSVNYSDFGGENYADLKGSDLLRMSEMDFEAKSPGYGKVLHSSLVMENIKCSSSSSSSSNNNMADRSYPELDGRSYLDLDGVPKNSFHQGCESDSENSRPSASGSPKPKAIKIEPPVEPPKKKRGRPRDPNKKGKKKPQTFGRLWEFLRELLRKRESCPSLIKWEDHDKGEFRFVQSDKVAKIWGTRKGNREMTYEKLSRAMRYHYEVGFLKGNKKRKVYQFGENATGWRVDDPNYVERDSLPKKELPNPILRWQPRDILEWLIEEAAKLGVDYEVFCGENYATLTGDKLLNMSVSDFEAKSGNTYGEYLYWCLFSKMLLLSDED